MDLVLSKAKREHFLFSWDARIKLLVSLSALLLTISYKGVVFPLLILLLCSAFFVKTRVPLRTIFIRYSEPLFIAMVLLLIKFFLSGKEPLFSLTLGPFSLNAYRDGLLEGLLIALRIISAVSIIIVLELSTPFTEIISALSWFKVPKTLIEPMIFAYRYIFILLEEAFVIYYAQRNRLGYSSIKRGMMSFSTLIGALIIKAFEHSQKNTIAMLQRGYDGNMPLLRPSKLKYKEIIVSSIFIAILFIAWKI